MPQRPHPDLDALLARAESMRDRSRRWSGTSYRSATPQFASNQDLLSGRGSEIHGGRWNPVGVPAVYSSTTPETAMAESLANARHYGLPIHTSLPRVFVALRLQLRKVIDLIVGDNRQRLRVSRARMLDADWHHATDEGDQPLTQAIGEAVARSRFEAMLVPSAADVPDGVNLVVFPANLLVTSVARVIAGID